MSLDKLQFSVGMALALLLGCGGTEPLPASAPFAELAMPQDVPIALSGQPERPGAPVGSNGPSAFNIEIRFDTAVGPSVRNVFARAADRWRSVIVNDLEDVLVEREQLPEACGRTDGEEPLAVDDVMVFVRVAPIDGAGGVLGAAGPCVLRSTDGSPLVGSMDLDSADIDQLQTEGKLGGVVLHEMGHVLGIGTLWGRAGLLRRASVGVAERVDTHFAGQKSIQAFEAVGGGQYQGGGIVPVENSGARGSADGHWREALFGNELMSPGLSAGDAGTPLSMVTIASLADLGFYEVDVAAADPFRLPLPTTSTAPRIDGPSSAGLALRTMRGGCALRTPEMTAHHDGTLVLMPN